MAIRVLIADDHSVVREGLRMFLGRDPELAVIGEAADGEEAVRLARQLRPDVVLMPVLDGIAATSAIRSELPETEVIALTSVLESARSKLLPPGRFNSRPRLRPTSCVKYGRLKRQEH